MAYDQERVVGRESFRVPLSRHSIDSVNLADEKLGLVARVNELLAASGLEKGRIDIVLGPGERNVGLTVNEYETLLMRHDLVEVLKDPLRFAVQRGRHMIDDPLAIPSKTINYATYDLPRLLNSLLDALHWERSVLERAIAKVMAFPARRLLRSRRVTFLASHDAESGRPRMIRGTYQSPILVQWQSAEEGARMVEISIVDLS